MSAAKNARANILFIVHESSTLASLISYLGRRGCLVWTCNTLAEAAGRLTNQDIDAVFISSTLRNVAHKKMGDAIFHQFGVSCVHFSEDGSARAERTLKSLEVPFKVEAPNSGSKIFAAIQAAMQVTGPRKIRRKGEAPKNQDETFLPRGAIPVPIPEIPREGRWIQLDEGVNPNPPYIFKLALPRSLRGKTNYYYRGPRSPIFDKASNLWEASSADGEFFQFTREAAKDGYEADTPLDEMYEDEESASRPPGEEPKKTSIIQKLFKAFDGTDENSDSVIVSEDNVLNLHDEAYQKTHPDLYKVKRKPATPLEKCLQASIMAMASQPVVCRTLKRHTPSRQFGVAVVKSKSFEGYLITPITSEEGHDYNTFTKVVEAFKEKMLSIGEALENISPPLLFTLDPMEFLPWAEAAQHFVSVTQNIDEEFAYVFLKAPVSEFIIKDDDSNMKPIPVHALRDDIILPFDIYLLLPKNEKYLLYCRKDKPVPPEAIAKFLRFNVKEVYIRDQDKHLFLSYSTASYVQRDRKAHGF